MTPVPKEYMIVCSRVVGGDGSEMTIEYHCTGERFPDRASAIKDGFESLGSDDFNIAVVRGNRLISFDWMQDPTGEDDDSLREIAGKLGLSI